MPNKILLVDDHKIIRDGLKSLLEKEKDFEVIAQAENGIEAIAAVKAFNPGVVLMDIAMPSLNGIEATRRILSFAPHIKIIVLSMHSEKHFVSEMIKAGAKGYLLKDSAFKELISALRSVISGRAYLSPSVAETLVEDYRAQLRRPREARGTELTSRENEIVRFVAEGMTSKEIARALKLSTKTVEAHRRNIMDKLGVSSIADLTKYAIRKGLTEV